VSSPQLSVRNDIKKFLQSSKTSFKETSDLKKAFHGADVVYWTRLQKEHLKDQVLPRHGMKITKQILRHLPKKAIIMHPLPRVDEIQPEVDADPRAKYFLQAGNGLYVRMALIERLLEGVT
jgi:aspartate carbamoyltransferase catalytic subunit